jgi:hypothetical protein
MKRFVLLAPMALASCAISKPVTVLLDKGQVMRGTTTVSLSGGSFSASDSNGLSCSGSYNPYDSTPTIAVKASCNDGRTANIVVKRDTVTGAGGSGTIEMSDGTQGKFLFGAAAEKF